VRSLASWVLAALTALAVTAAVLSWYADHSVFGADGFADRVDATLQQPAVSAAVAARLTDAAVASRPDLIAVRPLVASLAQALVRGEAFRSLARGAARDVHRSAFDRDATTVTLTLSDAGVLLAEALRHVRPDLAAQVPESVRLRLGGLHGGAASAGLRAAEIAQDVRAAALLSLLAALLLAAGAIAASGPDRRAAVTRLGVCVAAAGALSLAAATLAPGALAATDAGRVALHEWFDPLAQWCAALTAAGAIAALAAGSAARPVDVLALLRRLAATLRGSRARPLLAIASGVALILWPAALVELLAVSAGLLLVLTGVSELFRRAGAPVRQPRRGKPPARIAALAGLLIAIAAGGAALAGTGAVKPLRAGRCNGGAALCDRRLNDVAFVGTHNSMAADGEPGWLFAAQDAGIPAQLDEGVRALLIDTHYGFATPRGVATDLTRDSASRTKVVDEVGEQFVETAQRLRTRIGYRGGGTREVFLCHAFCEVGATPAQAALQQVHRFLVSHPEEVLILSIEDDTDAKDTAAIIRDSGLSREVYLGPARPPWPTLGDLIARDERVLVLIENEPGPEPWMHRQSDVMQETPYHFGTAQELAAPTSCEPNRGGTKGSLLLVNHWVDTSPAPRKTIAREVNAAPVLDARLQRCRTERTLLPTVVAVDFYRQGDVFGAVERLTHGG
jgi:hypothetical protein